MVRVRYFGTLFEFPHYMLYVQRAAVNEDSWDHAWRAHSLSYFQVINVAS